MARKKPRRKIEDIAEAAIACFIEAGFRRTQMADVARRLGIAAGTLYLYVASKEALLHLAVLQLAGRPPDSDALPIGISDLTETAALLGEQIGDGSHWPILMAARNSGAIPDADLYQAIGGELFDQLSQQRRIIWLIDACARDVPALQQAMGRDLRGRYITDLATLLTRRAADASPQSTELLIIARGALELMAWSAMHRHRDPSAPSVPSEAAVRTAAARAFAGALMAAC